MSIAEQIAKRKQVSSYESDPPETDDKPFEQQKEEATHRGEPWVAVLNTRVNPDNVKHGFFELDWNEQFIEVLLDDGYTGETQEELVEKWFHSVIRQMLKEEGMDIDAPAGNVVDFLKSPE